MEDGSSRDTSVPDDAEQPSEDAEVNIAQEIFSQQEDPIFANKSLLEISHVPSFDRIVGRDNEIRKLSEELRGAVQGYSPENVIVYGKTGTGKSLVSKYVSSQAVANAHDDVRIGYEYLDCSTDNTETQAASTLARAFNDPEETGLDIPERGLSTAAYYKRLWQVLEQRYDVVLIILDEADLMADDNLLMKLSRAGESGNTDCRIGVIAISNKIEWAEDLNERVKSSLQPKELSFHPYDAQQLEEILQHRRDAFKPDVLDDGVIPLCAAYAASDFGDARKAIDVLRHAGNVAYERDADTVTEQHVKDARTKAEKDRFKELVEGIPQQAKASLLALAILSLNSEQEEFPTQLVYRQYQNICDNIGQDVRSERRFRDILKELAFLGIVDNRKENLGRSGGITLLNRLVEEPEIVYEIIRDDARFETLTNHLSES
ncbi:cell division control protein 6 [Halogranum gelatinilyticum]|uniref:ORC1-type DNA replication protein n=1 Tax=Halogranum gelatinilyticum TaxID=660521 RepID=A0A1H0AAG2_9EURY|nr:orc1/cdc6 family replication initiation protein [Halogranum gelatinilyticum]SDN30550.1 cell division control protein 6 [Halogranum gelatinilyticum]